MLSKLSLLAQFIVYSTVVYLYVIAFETEASKEHREKLVAGKNDFFKIFCGKWEFLTIIGSHLNTLYFRFH
jgi:hypothetical protein